ncbi:MAG TPA: multicopper oxidase domain-containing protein [Solirubrobacteraceae bacterium]
MVRGRIVVTGIVTIAVLAGIVRKDSAAQAPDWTPVQGMALKDPAQVYPGKDGTVTVKLESKPATINVSGTPLGARPFGSDAPGPTSLDGPTIHVRPGGTIRVTFDNQLGGAAQSTDPPTNIHYHGLHVSPEHDSDNIFRTFDNGQTYKSVVEVTKDQPTGTYWYHVHFHGLSEGQLFGGLSGLLIIDGLSKHMPAEWRGLDQRQFALRDVQTSQGSIVTQNNISIPNPSTRLVNALYKPTFAMRQNHYELWRLANIGPNVFYKLQFRDRARSARHVRFAIIAEDGVPVWRVAQRDTLLLAPGKRFDVLLVAKRPGTYDLMSLQYAQRYVATPAQPPPVDTTALTPKPIPVEIVNGQKVPVDQTLATAKVVASKDPLTPATPLPQSLAPKEDFSDDPVSEARKRTFRFQYTPTGQPFQTMINDTVFSPYEMPMAAPVKDTVEQWTLINQTTDDHPFHIHVNGFQVISVNGKPYTAHGHQDVVNVPAQTLDETTHKLVDGRVVIRQKFKRFTGWFVFHCHILQHEDIGMMATVQVRDRATDPIEPPPEYRGPDPGHGGHAG